MMNKYYKCPSCKREKSWNEELVMKVCLVCNCEMEIIESKNPRKDYVVAVDLYLMRYVIKNEWYEIHDILREWLIDKKHTVRYLKDDLIFDEISIKGKIKK